MIYLIYQNISLKIEYEIYNINDFKLFKKIQKEDRFYLIRLTMKELFYQISLKFQFIMIEIIYYYEFDIYANIIKNNKDIIFDLGRMKYEKLC